VSERVAVRRTRGRARRANPGRALGIALLLAVGVPCATIVLGQDLPSADPPMSAGRTFDEQGGEALYERVCAACHQSDAKGAMGAAAYPALAADNNLASADYVEAVLLHGLRGMPPVGRMMSNEQVADVINYVRSHFGNDYRKAISAADVKDAR
jgi:mono/diheme cytochrome c family protein